MQSRNSAFAKKFIVTSSSFKSLSPPANRGFRMEKRPATPQFLSQSPDVLVEAENRSELMGKAFIQTGVSQKPRAAQWNFALLRTVKQLFLVLMERFCISERTRNSARLQPLAL
jgi:hypothetical protein